MGIHENRKGYVKGHAVGIGCPGGAGAIALHLDENETSIQEYVRHLDGLPQQATWVLPHIQDDSPGALGHCLFEQFFRLDGGAARE